MSPADHMEAVLYARAFFFRTCLIEGAGLFWIGAELAILAAMLRARRELAANRLDAAVNLVHLFTPPLLFLAVLAVLVYGRHLALSPVHRLIEAGALPTPEDAARLFQWREQEHLAIWALFVTAWVALELAIVWTGRRVFLLIGERLGGSGGRIRRGGGSTISIAGALALLMLALAATPAAFAAELTRGTLTQAHAADELYRNALYLYLRLAGVVWIAVEWVAAFYLWRGCKLFARAAGEQFHD